MLSELEPGQLNTLLVRLTDIKVATLAAKVRKLPTN
jgi:hypothetical protein